MLNIDGADVPLANVTEVTGGDPAGDSDADAGDETDEGTEG